MEVLQLLGDRQTKFLGKWTEDWSNGVQMKALLSATSFMTLQTLPPNDSVTGKLKIPKKGEYVQGDDYSRGMHSPQIRKSSQWVSEFDCSGYITDLACKHFISHTDKVFL